MCSKLKSMKVAVVVFLMSFLCCISAAGAAFGGGNNKTDREALLELKKQITDDPLGVVLSSWNGSTHFCTWSGVECGRRHQRVTVLNLGSQQLSGRIAPAIGNLSFLRELHLQNNSLRDEIPSEIGLLRRLELLDLRNNSLSGQIQSNLSRCTNLIRLSLSGNQLVGVIPSELGDVTNLRIIRLDHNSLTGSIPASLGNLTLLKTLYTSFNPLGGTIPDALGNLKNLKRLFMEENQLLGSIPPSFFNLSQLVHFYLEDNLLQGTLPPDMFTTLPYLQNAVLNKNKHLTGPIPTSISNATNLNYLHLGYNEFTGKVPSFQNLKLLILVDLYNNSLGTHGGLDGDDDLSFLCSLRNSTNLQYLVIGHNDFGGILPNCIRNLSVHLEIFGLNNNFITGRLPSEIGNLVSLTIMDMSNNQLSGAIHRSIGALRQMNLLFLDGNKLSGEIPNSLRNLTSLIKLILAGNNLQGSIPPSIGNLASLTELNLSQNSFSGTIPPQLMIFPLSLLYIDLSGNHLTGSIPPEVGRLMNLEELYFANNRLSGEIPSSIGSCTSLQVLNFSHNSFQGAIPSAFVSLRGIVELDLSHNNLSGEVPKFLGSFIYLVSLNLSYNDLEGTLPVEGVFKNTSAISVMGNRRLCGGIPELKLPRCELRKKREVSLKLILLISVGAAVLLVALSILILALFLFLSRRKRNKLASEPLGQSLLSVSYRSLLKATNNFSSTNLVGVGHFGSVYKGFLDSYQAPVAVKVLNPLCRGAFKSFTTECEALKSIRHRNLIRIITVCSSIDYQGGDFKALVYDFMTNGSLEEWLHPSGTEDGGNAEQAPARKLGFLARINIVIDVASALEYLHIHCQPPIAHCDVKPSNILLDEDMTAHVGDFGIARIFQKATSIDSAANQSNSSSIGIRGTIGYAPPEYGVGSQVSTTGDVYSFSILLLEMFTGKRPTADMFKERSTLRSFVKDALPGNVITVSDPTMLEDEEISYMMRTQNAAAFEDCLSMIFEIGIACSANVPKERKGMDVVVAELIGVRNKFVKLSGARLA